MFPLNVAAAGGFTFEITAEAGASLIGFRKGFEGSIVPADAAYLGNDIQECATTTTLDRLFFALLGNNLDQNIWSVLAITGTFTFGTTTLILLSADANPFTPVSGLNSRWTFDPIPGKMIDGNVYRVTIS